MSTHLRPTHRRPSRFEALELREMLAADLFTYGNVTSETDLSYSASEWSGAAYWTDGSSEYVILLESGDDNVSPARNATIHRVGLNGTDRHLIATIQGYYDSEALAWLGDDDFAIVEEQSGEISFLTVAPTITTPVTLNPAVDMTTLAFVDPTGKTGLVHNLITNNNEGIEGLAFDGKGTTTTADDVFYIAKEDNSNGSFENQFPRIFQFA